MMSEHDEVRARRRARIKSAQEERTIRSTYENRAQLRTRTMRSAMVKWVHHKNRQNQEAHISSTIDEECA